MTATKPAKAKPRPRKHREPPVYPQAELKLTTCRRCGAQVMTGWDSDLLAAAAVTDLPLGPGTDPGVYLRVVVAYLRGRGVYQVAARRLWWLDRINLRRHTRAVIALAHECPMKGNPT
jgi:hypothetical protein